MEGTVKSSVKVLPASHVIRQEGRTAETITSTLKKSVTHTVTPHKVATLVTQTQVKRSVNQERQVTTVSNARMITR